MRTPSRRVTLLGAVVLGVVLGAVGLRTMTAPSGSEPGKEFADVLVAPEATPELASRAMDRLELFRAGNAGLRLSLGSDDVTALLRHGFPGVLPAGVADPRVTFVGDRLRVEARVATAEFPGSPRLASALGALPDTVAVDLLGRLVSARGHVRFEVQEARAGPIPVPLAVVSAIARELVQAPETRMASSNEDPAFVLRQPRGFSTVEVANGRLVLRRDERMIDRAVDGSDDP